MGLVGQDRGELHTRNRGISRRVTIQWLSHKSLWMASSDVLRGAGGIVGPRCSAGGPTMTLDNGVRTVFTGCTSADTRPVVVFVVVVFVVFVVVVFVVIVFVRAVFTRCTSADTRPDTGPSVALKQCHDGRGVAPGIVGGHESAIHLLDYKAAD